MTNRPSVFHAKNSILCCLLAFTVFSSCTTKNNSKKYAVQVYQTSQSGDNLKLISNQNDPQSATAEDHIVLQVNPDKEYQKYVGFGASFTESSAWNLATILIDKRKEVLTKLFSPNDGTGFTLTRTHINSSDYSNNHYSYVEPRDENLSTFSILEDKKGF